MVVESPKREGKFLLINVSKCLKVQQIEAGSVVGVIALF